MSVAENLKSIKSELPEDVCLVAVSKTKPNALIEEAYAAGHRDFGENKAQELQGKAAALPADIKWHFIGHLQRNKVKYIAPAVHLIHSVDSLRLLKEIDKRAKGLDRTIDVLLQVYIAKEESKFGLDEEEIEQLLASSEYKEMHNIRVVGLMGMATNTDNKETVAREFKSLKTFFDQLKETHFNSSESFKSLSMGMSGDYKIALAEGSNMLRIGSSIFGTRDKN